MQHQVGLWITRIGGIVPGWSVSADGSYLLDSGVHLSDFEQFSYLLQCSSCGYQTKVESYSAFYCRNKKCRLLNDGDLVLWIKYRQTVIWAYNEEHLNYLEAFVRARVRRQPDRYTHSVFATLPSIYRSKKDRESVLAKIHILRSRIRS